jgi:hypothetical protein
MDAATPDNRLAVWAFAAFVVAAVPLVLFHYGDYHWFFRDDFVFLADRTGRLPDVLAPHGGAHWVGIPRVVYWGLWQLFGMRSYVPYQLCVVVVHLSAVVLLRVVMRRAGVGPWLATGAACMLVLFGPGAGNIVWAFQISFTGSLAFGLVHLLLADHDDGFSRRDLLGLVAGLFALMCSAVGITMVVVVGLAVLLRRGWWAAFTHTAPLAAVFGMWMLAEDPTVSNGPLGRPTVEVLWAWVRRSVVATFEALGHFQVLAVILVLLLLVGTGLAITRRDEEPGATRRRLAAPAALLAGGPLFAATTGWGRWWIGLEGAEGDRYIYMIAAFSLPMLAVSAQEVARRWRVLTPVLLAVFLVPIPFNLEGFTPTVFGPRYMEQREHVLRTAVRMPFAKDVPRDVQPILDPFQSQAVTIGFLRTAKRNGDLNPSTMPLTPEIVNEFKVRLGVAARPGRRGRQECTTTRGRVELAPRRGEVLVLGGPVRIATWDGRRVTGPWVGFTGGGLADELTIELPDLRLVVAPAIGQNQLTLCRPRV